MMFFLMLLVIALGTPKTHIMLHICAKSNIGPHSIESIPLDVMLRMMNFLSINDLQSMKRSCKSNLRLCRQYICNLISSKFRYLLVNEPAITIEHLIKIPLIDPLKMNILHIPFHFGKDNRTNSVYIGFANSTKNAFISFWIHPIALKQAARFVTFVFNETSIESIYLSKRSHNLARSQKVDSIWYKYSDLNDLAAIRQLLLKGKISLVLNSSDVWCLNDKLKAVHADHERAVCILEFVILIVFLVLVALPVFIILMFIA